MKRIALIALLLLLATVAYGQNRMSGVRYAAAPAAGGGNDLTDDAVACWWLDASDTTADICSGTHTATEQNTPSYGTDAPTMPRYATVVDTDNEHFTVADAAALRVCEDGVGGGTEGSCTMGCFVRHSAGTPEDNGARYFHKGTLTGTEWFIFGHWHGNDELRGYMGGGPEDGTTPSATNDQSWHHVVLSWDGDGDNEVKLYLDAELDCSGGTCTDLTPTGNVNSTDDLFLGAGPADADNFDGDMGQCAVFDYQLSLAEICDWCSTGLDGLDTDRNSSMCNSCTISP